MTTTATSGSISSPGFRGKFDAHKFKKVYYSYLIYLPTNLDTLFLKYPNLYLSLNIVVDVQYGDNEYVKLTTNSSSEVIENTAHSDLGFPAKNLQQGDHLLIEFYRNIEQSDIDNKAEKRMTGFSLNWSFNLYWNTGGGS
jgi:hypothetical protein